MGIFSVLTQVSVLPVTLTMCPLANIWLSMSEPQWQNRIKFPPSLNEMYQRRNVGFKVVLCDFHDQLLCAPGTTKIRCYNLSNGFGFSSCQLTMHHAIQHAFFVRKSTIIVVLLCWHILMYVGDCWFVWWNVTKN